MRLWSGACSTDFPAVEDVVVLVACREAQAVSGTLPGDSRRRNAQGT